MFENIEKLENASLKNFSTMRVGGKAKVIVFPKNHLQLLEIIETCTAYNLKWMILGNGSNILFLDEGFDGVLINLKHFNQIYVCKNYVEKSQETEVEIEHASVWAGAGCNMFVLNQSLAKLGIGGLEWSYGIPATLGGMLYMNGGCFNHEIGQFVEEVLVLDGKWLKRLKKSELKFEYRHSNLQKYIILGAKLLLYSQNSEEIAQNMQFYLNKKKESQPCEYPSLGSIFKRIEGQQTIYPAKVIDELGLKGQKIGGAEVSTKHAGFIVNTGGATAADVLALIDLLQSKMAERGIKANPEIVVCKNV